MSGVAREDDHRAWWRLPAAAVVALAIQLPLFGFLDSQTRGRGDVSVCDPMVGRYLRTCELPWLSDPLTRVHAQRCHLRPKRPMRGVALRVERKKKEEPPEPPLPKDAQIVEVPARDEPKEPPPVETKYVSNHSSRTKRQTRSRRSARSAARSAGSVALDNPSPAQSPDSRSPEPTVTSESEREIRVADTKTKLPEAESGQRRPESIVRRGADTRILLPSTSAKAALANLQALSGEFSSTDHLPELPEGKSTLLNANRYRYADFFLRVKRAVEKHWHPAQIYRRRDPTGRAYGVKDRYTLIRVTLDDSGRVQRLLTTRDSGLEFMDREAKEAFERAQPFPNPPDGLLGPKNELVFEFGFYFEITAGKHRFSWRRL